MFMERRYSHLSLEERDRITEMRASGDGLGEIAPPQADWDVPKAPYRGS